MPNKKSKKINSEEPLIDKSGELLKKLIAKGKRQGFLKRDECETILDEGQFEDKDEFYSKIENLKRAQQNEKGRQLLNFNRV